MEPQIIDHYNELPSGIHVIDKMNEELEEAQTEIEILKKNQRTESENKFRKKFQMPRIKVSSFEEYKEKEYKLNEFYEYISNIRVDEEETLISLFEDYLNYGNTIYISSYGILSVLINKLDDLTNNLNKDWCEKRILTSIEVYMTLKDNIAPNSLVDIIDGISYYNGGEIYLPRLYLELSIMNTSDEALEDYDEEQIINFRHIWYYNCDKCGKSSSYGVYPPYHNKLLCCNCHSK
jgi:hypothetical protein